MLATFMAADRDNHHLSGWSVLSWHDIISHHEKCACLSARGPFPIRPSITRASTRHSVTPHLSILDFINVTSRDLTLLGWDVTTLTEDWPGHLTTNKLVVCMMGDHRGLMGEEKKTSVKSVCFLVGILSNFSFPETSTSTSIPSFNELSQSQKWRRHSSRREEGEETATNHAYRIRTHTRGRKKKLPPPPPHCHLMLLSASLTCASLALSLCHV